MAGRLSTIRAARAGVQRALARLALASAVLAAPFAARAASLYTATISSADLGRVTSGVTGDTDFRIDPTTASVTVVGAGTAVRAVNSSTRAAVTVTCAKGQATDTNDCSQNVNIRLVAAGTAVGRARALTRITFIPGTATLAGGPGPPGVPAFTIAPIGVGGSVTFYVGADFSIAGDDSGLATGPAEADFTVEVSEGTPTTGPSGRFIATVIRSIAVSKTADLVFGRVQLPSSGTGSVSIDANTGVRTLVNAIGLDTPTPARAAFTVTGEGGQAFSVTLPSSITMSGPQTLTAATTLSSAPLTLSNTLGSAGSLAIGVGASIPLSATTATGDYSGSFTVTVAYN